MSDEKVIFLAYSNPNVTDATITHLSCVVCRNMTYVIQQLEHGKFPVILCAVCRARIGAIGWADDADNSPG